MLKAGVISGEAQSARTPRGSSHGGTRDIVVRDVIQGLYDGRYEPGQRLQEAQMTAAFGISRGPVREALNVLAAMNIVALTPQRGAQIRVLRAQEAIDILVVAQNLMALSCRLAALNNGRQEDRDRLEHALRTLEGFAPGSEGAAFAMARDSFYGAINAMAGNSELSRLLPTVRIHLIRVQFRLLLRPRDESRHADYSRIAQAILAGKPKEAEAAMRSHFDRAIKALIEYKAD